MLLALAAVIVPSLGSNLLVPVKYPVAAEKAFQASLTIFPLWVLSKLVEPSLFTIISSPFFGWATFKLKLPSLLSL